MRKLSIGILLMFVGSLAMSQTTDDYVEIMRSVLKTEKKAAIAELMDLTKEEGEVFWPLYNEFNEKIYEIGTREVKIINDYGDNFNNMTDEKADEIWTSYMKTQTDYLKLEKLYYKKFKKILPAGRVAKYFQAENKINALIDAQLAVEIPFIETK